MKILCIFTCTLLLSGCSLFNAQTSVYKGDSDIPVFRIEHPRYSVVEYEKDGEKVKVDSTGGSSILDKVTDVATLGLVNEAMNPND